MPELDNGALDPQPQDNILVNNILEAQVAFVPGMVPGMPANAFEELRDRINNVENDDIIEFNDEDDDDDDMEFDPDLEEEMDHMEREAREAEQWENEARQALNEGRMPPPVPEHMQVREAAAINQFQQPARNVRIRRGNRAVVEEGRLIPAGMREQPQPRPFRPGLAKAKMPAVAKKITAYVPEGVMYNGYRFTRELLFAEKNLLALLGYYDFVRKFPDLIWVPKDVPIDENEECVIMIAELADFLAVQACKTQIDGFNIKEHTKEYQIVYKRFLKDITLFKRPKNG